MNIKTFFGNTKNLMKLAYPILVAQLVQNLMGFADTVMAGHVSSTDMAAVAIASSVWLPLILTICGLVIALTTIVSQLSGGKKFQDVANATYQTAWLCITFGLLLIALFYLAIPYLYDRVPLELKLKNLMFDYLKYIVWGAPAFCAYLVLRAYSEGLSHTKPSMVISIIGLLINIPANYIFINGAFGIPALGGAGCGIATALVYWVMFLVTLGYSYYAKALKHAWLFERFYWPQWAEIKNILVLGTPIALSLLFEVSLFSAVAIILAPLGAQIVASHQIAINFSGLVFMIPLSFAMAVTIQVATTLGENNSAKAKEIAKSSLLFGLAIATLTALTTIIFRVEIAQIYSYEEPVIELAAGLMFLAALFQFSDAIQVISAGVLRGYKDTKAILYITFTSYWVIGLGIGYLLGMTDLIVSRLGPYGFWIGFISGLTTAAIMLTYRLRIIQHRYASKTLNVE